MSFEEVLVKEVRDYGISWDHKPEVDKAIDIGQLFQKCCKLKTAALRAGRKKKEPWKRPHPLMETLAHAIAERDYAMDSRGGGTPKHIKFIENVLIPCQTILAEAY